MGTGDVPPALGGGPGGEKRVATVGGWVPDQHSVTILVSVLITLFIFCIL